MANRTEFSTLRTFTCAAVVSAAGVQLAYASITTLPSAGRARARRVSTLTTAITTLGTLAVKSSVMSFVKSWFASASSSAARRKGCVAGTLATLISRFCS